MPVRKRQFLLLSGLHHKLGPELERSIVGQGLWPIISINLMRSKKRKRPGDGSRVGAGEELSRVGALVAARGGEVSPLREPPAILNLTPIGQGQALPLL